mgnify:CR=1 FL=1
MSRWRHRLMEQGAAIALAALLGACAMPSLTGVASPTPTPTPRPSPTPTLSPTHTTTAAPPSATPTPTATSEPTRVPPLAGSFDVYLSAPNENGEQELLWINVNARRIAARATIRTDNGYAIRAGPYVYFQQASTHRPYRANTAGFVEPLTFASPPADVGGYQLLPSANGDWLAWLSTDRTGTYYELHRSTREGGDVRLIARGDMEAGSTITLVRLSNDGRMVFYALQPPGIADVTPFNARYDLYGVDAETSAITHLPGEPACGLDQLCDGHISPDGAYLARTLPSIQAAAPVVVTNLITGQVIARYTPQGIPAGSVYEVGYPFFTPSGDLIYFEAIGAAGTEDYVLVLANIVTGEQRIIAYLGKSRHRPLGWAGEGFVLLTTREPAAYDTWQIDLRDGKVRQISSLLFLGHIEQPPIAP